MATCGSLSKEVCPQCALITLHASGVCIHCRSRLDYARQEYDPEKGVRFTIKNLDWNPPKPKVHKGGGGRGRRVNHGAY